MLKEAKEFYVIRKRVELRDCNLELVHTPIEEYSEFSVQISFEILRSEKIEKNCENFRESILRGKKVGGRFETHLKQKENVPSYRFSF